jgi:hypothetical protein
VVIEYLKDKGRFYFNRVHTSKLLWTILYIDCQKIITSPFHAMNFNYPITNLHLNITPIRGVAGCKFYSKLNVPYFIEASSCSEYNSRAILYIDCQKIITSPFIFSMHNKKMIYPNN